jgi:phosphoglycolate phosphatase-like HAD superfamily hydrolase
MARRSALLVDLDGTLTDNLVGIARSIRHALLALGALVASPAAIVPVLDALRPGGDQRSV